MHLCTIMGKLKVKPKNGGICKKKRCALVEMDANPTTTIYGRSSRQDVLIMLMSAANEPTQDKITTYGQWCFRYLYFIRTHHPILIKKTQNSSANKVA